MQDGLVIIFLTCGSIVKSMGNRRTLTNTIYILYIQHTCISFISIFFFFTLHQQQCQSQLDLRESLIPKIKLRKKKRIFKNIYNNRFFHFKKTIYVTSFYIDIYTPTLSCEKYMYIYIHKSCLLCHHCRLFHTDKVILFIYVTVVK